MNPQLMVDLNARLTGIPRHVEPLRVDEFLAEQNATIDLLRQVAAKSGAKVLDPLPDVCQSGVCANISDDGRPVSKDAGHFRPFYVESKIKMFDPLFARSTGE